jgi:hypothetical protein
MQLQELQNQLSQLSTSDRLTLACWIIESVQGDVGEAESFAKDTESTLETQDYLTSVAATMTEWNSPEDEEAYHDL